jgi:hypothetical protein
MFKYSSIQGNSTLSDHAKGGEMTTTATQQCLSDVMSIAIREKLVGNDPKYQAGYVFAQLIVLQTLNFHHSNDPCQELPFDRLIPFP